MKSVTVLIGSGLIGIAIARRVSAGKHVLLADLRKENADAAAAVLSNAGFEVSTVTVDISSREAVKSLAQKAASLGDVTEFHHRKHLRSKFCRLMCMARQSYLRNLEIS